MIRSAGERAPEFELMDDEGNLRKLSDYRGQTIVLYFYSRDNTPGCTKEACSFRDAYADFREAGVEVIGISPDSEQSHAKFKSKYELPFTLLADPDRSVCKAYGVWGPKKMAEREYEGVYRTTFVIDPDGVIKKVFEKVKPADHSQEVLAVVRA